MSPGERVECLFRERTIQPATRVARRSRAEEDARAAASPPIAAPRLSGLRTSQLRSGARLPERRGGAVTPDAPHLAEAVEGVLECAPVGIAACDAEMRWVAWNPAMEALTGHASARVLGEAVDAGALAGEQPHAVL